MLKKSLLIVALGLFGLTAYAAGDPIKGKDKSIGCTGCHGANGVAVQPMHPDLAGQKERYLMWQLSSFRNNKRPSHIMNEIAANLSDEDIEDLAAYYSSLNKCN